MASFKMGRWDGYIRLFNRRTQGIYKGLISYVKAFCESRGYDFEDLSAEPKEQVTKEDTIAFLKSLELPKKMGIVNDQVESITHCINEERCVLVSPTASGKSFIIYSLIRHFEKKTLVIVPTTALVHQMYDNFEEYSENNGWNTEENCSKIMGGYEKNVSQDRFKIDLENGQSIYLYGNQFVTLINKKKKLMKDLNEEDEICPNWLQENFP